MPHQPNCPLTGTNLFLSSCNCRRLPPPTPFTDKESDKGYTDAYGPGTYVPAYKVKELETKLGKFEDVLDYIRLNCSSELKDNITDILGYPLEPDEEIY